MCQALRCKKFYIILLYGKKEGGEVLRLMAREFSLSLREWCLLAREFSLMLRELRLMAREFSLTLRELQRFALRCC